MIHSYAKTYADDTTTGTSSKYVEKVIKRLEEDAKNVLKFMGSNSNQIINKMENLLNLEVLVV